jgi:hypothetical protein
MWLVRPEWWAETLNWERLIPGAERQDDRGQSHRGR